MSNTLNIEDYDQFNEEDLVTVFCHLRVRKIRARMKNTCLRDLEEILAGSKYKTICFLRTKVGRVLFYERFKNLWREKILSDFVVKEPELNDEFASYFKSIEKEVESETMSCRGGRGKPTQRTE